MDSSEAQALWAGRMADSLVGKRGTPEAPMLAVRDFPRAEGYRERTLSLGIVREQGNESYLQAEQFVEVVGQVGDGPDPFGEELFGQLGAPLAPGPAASSGQRVELPDPKAPKTASILPASQLAGLANASKRLLAAELPAPPDPASQEAPVSSRFDGRCHWRVARASLAQRGGKQERHGGVQRV